MTTQPQPKERLNLLKLLDDIALQTAPPHLRAALEAGHFGLSFAPPIPEPPLAAAAVPVGGSAWQGGKDLQEGRYFGALFNGASAGLEALPAFAVATQAQRVRKVNKALEYKNKVGSRPLTDRNVREAFSTAGLTGKKTGKEAHHTFPFNGVDRKPPNWRNDPWLVEPRLTPNHRRITGSWNGQPRFDPVTRAWHESSTILKAGLAGVAAYGADLGENLVRGDRPPQKPQR